ncbi:MAG: polyphosphate kinase 2 family protein [Planctomycetaceae bacterium]
MNLDHRLTPGSAVTLEAIQTNADGYPESRKVAEKEFKGLRNELAELQNLLYADGSQKLLVVFQAMDAGGKDGTIRKVFRGVNPQGVKVTSFKRPSTVELAHDFLWRTHLAVPGKGMVGVFNRSHYEDVLVVRVDEIVPESIWRPRYEMINNFEHLLSKTGTRILKFYLHISREEQKQRFEERLEIPEKHWKFDVGDLKKREQWADYMAAYEEMLQQCTTDEAPWYVIPSDQKWYRNLAITRVIVDTLKDMNLAYPEQTDDLSGITIPD